MSLLQGLYLIGGIGVGSLSIFIYLNNPKSLVNRWLAGFSFGLTIWLFGSFIALFCQSSDKALFWYKLGYVGVVCVPMTVYNFAAYFLEYKKDNLIKIISIAFSLFFSSLLIGNKLIVDVAQYSWGLYPRAGHYHKFFLIGFVLISAWTYYILLLSYVKRRHEVNDILRSRIIYVFWALVIGNCASIDFLPNYGISIFPLGFACMIGMVATFTYAILAYQLLEIEVVIRRTAVFAGLFAFVYGVFTFVSILGNEFFRDTLGWNQWVAMIPTVAIVTFALRPLENWLTNLTDKFLFQKKYDYRELLKVFTNEILTVLDLKELTNRTVLGLNNIIKLESAAVLLHDKAGKSYNMVASFGVKNRELSFKEEDALVSFINATQAPIQRDKKSDQMEGHSYLKEDFMALNARLCLPIVMHDQLLGILALGMKKSGEDYTQEDLDILMTLARTEGIAISNAQLFDELAKTQAEAAQSEKMAVIGTLAAGINHEICNPLGIVRGQCEMFLLNLRDGFYNTKTQEEITKIFSDIMVKVIKETDRATAITKKLSGFAKPSKRSDLEEISVDKEVEEVLGLLAHDMKLNNISLEKQIPQNLPLILADRKQIQEVLFNIIRNAAQAMDEKKQGKISIASISENGSVLIKIQDNGVGIPKDKLDAVFHPFYTTKAPGQGTGLGLFIVKQVVEKNKGNIEVESEAGVGTTFTLKFPAAQHAGIN